METKFTKGEWRVNKWELEHYVGIEIKDSQDNCICTIQQLNAGANAKLIAAAPELFFACVAILENLEINKECNDIPTEIEIQTMINILKRVLNKATL